MLKENTIRFYRCLFNSPSPVPVEVQLEITNKCNFTCPMCPREFIDAPAVHMDFELFKEVVGKLLDAGKPGVRDYILTGWGEPLLHPDFFDMVDFIHSRNTEARIRFTTNGALLKEKVRRRILDSAITQVTVSMDGIDNQEDGSDALDGHFDSEKVMGNVAALAAERGPEGKPEIVFQSAVMCDNQRGLENLLRKGAEIGVNKMNLVRLDVRGKPHSQKGTHRKEQPGRGKLVRPNKAEERQTGRQLMQAGRKAGIDVVSINQQGPVLQLAGHFDRLCIKTVDHFYVNVAGDVNPCCNLRNLKMGNLLTEEVEQIWHGEKFKNFRSNQLRICGGCDILKKKHLH